MPVRISWRSTMPVDRLRVTGKKYAPKVAVIWRGRVWARYVEGDSVVTDSREWKAPFPIRANEAQRLLQETLDLLIDDNKDKDVEALIGFDLFYP